MEKNEIGENNRKFEKLATELVFRDESGYFEATADGVIGIGSGKWSEEELP